MSWCDEHVCPDTVCEQVHRYVRTEQQFRRGYQRGQMEMLDSIRAALRDYPNAGGDVVVMREVERIVLEALDNRQKGS